MQKDDGSGARGAKRAPLRPLWDTAGVLPQAAVAPRQGHASEVCRPLRTSRAGLRAGARRVADHGFMAGDRLARRQHEPQGDVSGPLRSTMSACDEAVRLAPMADTWQAHPSRATQQIALVPGVQHVWHSGTARLNAGVMRSWQAKKHRHGSIVLVTTDQALTATWSVRHDEERPEIAQDEEQMKRGGWT